MKLDTFFEKFDLFPDAPDALTKLRGLVRHLAVTGKLVAQDPNDQPALSLLEEIAAHKSALAAEGKLRGSTTVTPMAAYEGRWELPASWTWVHFGEIMINRDGERIPVSKEEREGKAKTFDYYGASGVIDKIDNYLFDKPLLLIGEDGANLINRSTPIAFIARGKYWVNNHAHVLDALSEDLLRYVELHVNAINLERYVTGSAQPKMNQAKMNSIPIALPPLAEQKRIVAKVDELMALCDQLEAQQEQRELQSAALARASLARFTDAPTPANLDLLFHKSYSISPADLRRSILTLAVRGKLVPQDSNDELPLVTRAGQCDELFEIPESWKWIQLWNVEPEFQNGASSRGDRDGTPIVVIRLADIRGRRIHLDEPRAITIAGEQISKYELKVGDTLITRVNGSADIVGTFIPVQHALDAIYCDHFIRMRIDPERLLPAYTALLGESQLVRDQIQSLFITTAGQKTVNQSHIRSLYVALPPLAEQRRIVAKVDELLSLVDALEAQLASARITGAALLEAVVAELKAGV